DDGATRAGYEVTKHASRSIRVDGRMDARLPVPSRGRRQYHDAGALWARMAESLQPQGPREVERRQTESPGVAALFLLERLLERLRDCHRNHAAVRFKRVVESGELP